MRLYVHFITIHRSHFGAHSDSVCGMYCLKLHNVSFTGVGSNMRVGPMVSARGNASL